LCGSTDIDRAAAFIRGGLEPLSSKQSSVIHLSFKHPYGDVVLPVLQQVITNYFERHKEVHRPQADFDEKLATEKTDMETELRKTERMLNEAKTSADVISLEDSRRDYAAKIAKLEEQLLLTVADLQERQAKAKRLKEYYAGVSSTNTSSADTNAATESLADVAKPVPTEVLSEYKRLIIAIERLQTKDDDLALEWTPEYYLRKKLKSELAAKDEQKKKLETTYPDLLMTPSLRRDRRASRTVWRLTRLGRPPVI
jgi:hypothetical protein